MTDSALSLLLLLTLVASAHSSSSEAKCGFSEFTAASSGIGLRRPQYGPEDIEVRSDPYARTEFPWHVLLYAAADQPVDMPNCSAVLADANWILTASSCPLLSGSTTPTNGRAVLARFAFDVVRLAKQTSAIIADGSSGAERPSLVVAKQSALVPPSNVVASGGYVLLKLPGAANLTANWQLRALCLLGSSQQCSKDGRYSTGPCSANKTVTAVGWAAGCGWSSLRKYVTYMSYSSSHSRQCAMPDKLLKTLDPTAVLLGAASDGGYVLCGFSDGASGCDRPACAMEAWMADSLETGS